MLRINVLSDWRRYIHHCECYDTLYICWQKAFALSELNSSCFVFQDISIFAISSVHQYANDSHSVAMGNIYVSLQANRNTTFSKYPGKGKGRFGAYPCASVLAGLCGWNWAVAIRSLLTLEVFEIILLHRHHIAALGGLRAKQKPALTSLISHAPWRQLLFHLFSLIPCWFYGNLGTIVCTALTCLPTHRWVQPRLYPAALKKLKKQSKVTEAITLDVD